MDVVLLGTGAADGVPQPFCDCPTCAEARATGEVRAPGAVLVDGTLLIDAPPGLAGAAGRAGVSLADVRTIAVTHAHTDHWDPSVLLFRSWAGGGGGLRVVGPPAVLASARAWLPPDTGVWPDTGVELVPAVPGESIDLGGHVLRVLPSTHGRTGTGGTADDLAAEAVLYDVRTHEAALLYAADTGVPDEALLVAVAGADYDTVLLELTFGAAGPSTPGHLDHVGFATTLGMLRGAGAINARTDVVAIHVGHHNPPAAELSAALAGMGARVVPDGTRLLVGLLAALTTRRVLITGGARSGKSHYAEGLAARAGGDVIYVATGWPAGEDESWARRVLDHQQRRPASWRTVETDDPAAVLATAPAGATVLIDCLALWTTRLVDGRGAWDESAVAREAVDAALAGLVDALRSTRAGLVLVVTNEVGSGVVPATVSGGLFRDLLGRVNAAVSAACDEAVLMVAGRPLPLGPVSVTRTPATRTLATTHTDPAARQAPTAEEAIA